MYSIVKTGADSFDELSNTITVSNVYVVRVGDRVCFEGTYNECLTFIGARYVRHSEVTARNFAKGNYR